MQFDRGAEETNSSISEAPPMILRSVLVRGLDSVPERAGIVRGLPIREGRRFDRFVIDAAADTVRQRLHNNGYPRAEAENHFNVNDSALVAWDTLAVMPGPRTKIGAIKINVSPLPGKKQQIPTRIVSRI